jgi:hypothetical protein
MIVARPPYVTIPEPDAPALPVRGRQFTDPNFGTMLVQITGPEDGKTCRLSYGIWSIASCKYTKLLIQIDGLFRIRGFDPVAGTIEADIALPASFQGTDAIWSHTDDNLIYHRDGGSRLMCLDVSTNIDSVIHDFAADFPTSPYLARMSGSSDDKRFCFARQTTAYAWAGFVVWDRETGVLYSEPPSRTGQYFKVQIDKSGWEMWNVALDPQSEWWDLSLPNTQQTVLTPGTGHSAVLTCRSAQYDNTANADVLHPFGRAMGVTTITWPDWEIATEYSGTDGNEDWYAVTAGTLKPIGPLHDELLQVSTDGSGTVRRLCHMHNVMKAGDYDSIPQPATGYGAFPWIAFHSSWGDSGRRDVFLAKVDKGVIVKPVINGIQRLEYNAIYGTGLKGAAVTIGGLAALVSYDSDTQVNFVVPAELIGKGDVQVVITAGGVASDPISTIV